MPAKTVYEKLITTYSQSVQNLDQYRFQVVNVILLSCLSRSHIKRMHNESTETYEDYILENGLDQNDHYNMLGNGSDANDHDQIQDMSHFLDIQVEEGEENSTELDPLDPQDIEDGLFEQNYEENASENGDIPSDLDDRHYLDGEVTNEDYQP